MFVYRVEHKVCGNGPYTSANKCLKLYETHNHLVGTTKPSWFIEGFWTIKNMDKYKACCNSIESLLDWFDWFTEYLDEMTNFHIVKYWVDDDYVKNGESGLQSIFLPVFATKVDSIPIDRIEEWF